MVTIRSALAAANLPNSAPLMLRTGDGLQTRLAEGTSESELVDEKGSGGLRAVLSNCSWPPRQGGTEEPERFLAWFCWY